MSDQKAESESTPMVWHDEADRLLTWGTLDPTHACMCRDCALTRPGSDADHG